MALDYAKEDLSRYLQARDLTRLPFNFQLIMFPYRGRQPPPFDTFNITQSFTDRSPDTRQTKRSYSSVNSSANSEVNLLRMESPSSGLGYDPEQEIRWWFYPLIFAGEIPLDTHARKIVCNYPFTINPLCAKTPRYRKIQEVNPGVISDLSDLMKVPVTSFPSSTETSIGWSDVAVSERYRMFCDVKRIARALKKEAPEIFGESGDVDSGRYPDGVTPVEDQSKKGFRAKIKSISPKFGRKFSRSTSAGKREMRT